MTNPHRREWSDSELVKVISLYHQIPFGRMHARAPEVIHLANLIGRSPSAVALKLVNFASMDKTLQSRGVKGMRNHSRRDEEIWNAYLGKWVDLSESLKLPEYPESDCQNKYDDFSSGRETTRKTMADVRIGQAFFRRSVLANFGGKCCLTGIACSDLVRASHIIPWSMSEQHRLNPRNGLLLNAILDAAFDKGWITLDESYCAVVSRKLTKEVPDEVFKNYFASIHRKKISAERFYPDLLFLDFHNKNCFRGSPL